VIHNFKIQLDSSQGNLNKLQQEVKTNSLTSEEKKSKENIEAIIKAVKKSDILPSNPTQGLSLRNSFTSTTATNVQQNDLLNFYSIGQTDLDKHLKRTYLGVQSKEVPGSKQHRLNTFSTVKHTKRRYNQLQKEKDLITNCLKTCLLHCSNNNKRPSLEQYLEVSRALADLNGMPHKGDKSSTTGFYTSKYGEEVSGSHYDISYSGWLPDSVVLVNSSPNGFCGFG